LFVEASEHRGSVGFWLEWGWVGDVHNFAYSKHKCVSGFFGEWGGFRFRGVYWFVCDVGRVSGVVGWPHTNANAFLVYCRDFKFGVGYKGVKGLIPPNEEPRIVDEFKG
jgi:hypothetical protein